MHIAGISPLDSWDWTWGEGIEAVNAYTLRENERTRKQSVALYNAAVFLTRTLVEGGQIQGFHEAFPGFGNANREASSEMSDNAMYSVVRALNAQFGGEEEN